MGLTRLIEDGKLKALVAGTYDVLSAVAGD
jgi:hypothetical protein